MSTRQARNLRRAAERRQRKLERKMKEIDHAERNAAQPSNGFVFSTTIEDLAPNLVEAAASSPGPLDNPPTELRDGSPSAAPAVSPARLAANRQNAQRSSGPTSATGKLASSRNSLKHGLASGTLIIPGEDPADFDALEHALLEEHPPATQTEQLLIHEMAQSWWLTQRAIRLQNECFTESCLDDERTGCLVPVVRVEHARLSLLIRYQTTHERAFHRALATLSRLQKERRRNELGFVSQDRQFVRQNPPANGFVSRTSTGNALEATYTAAFPTCSINQSRYSAALGSPSLGAHGAKSLSFATE